ncbi:MAG: PQQ-dependent sugar dehydrogenase, partial [Patescibacteria group bacterium]
MNVRVFLIVLIAALGVTLLSFIGVFDRTLAPGEQITLPPQGPEKPISAIEPMEYVIEEVVRGLEIPWSIAFTSAERILVTERPGRLRVIENGILKPEPIKIFSEVSSQAEEGLMGLALYPDYKKNRLIYLSLAYKEGEKMFVKVLRFRDEGARLSGEKIIIDKIPAAQFHAGSRIKFGPDGMLYI